MGKNKKNLFKSGFLTLIFILVGFSCSFYPNTSDVDGTVQVLQITQQAIDLQLTQVASNDADITDNTSVQTEIATAPTRKAEISLGEEYRSEEGGFAFRRIPNYSVESLPGGYTTMLAPNADPFFGPVIEFNTENYDFSSTVEQSFEELKQLYSEGNTISFVNKREITVDGKSGIVADFSGAVENEEIVGRLVVVKISSTKEFEMIGGAPREKWIDLDNLFDSVLSTVTFFNTKENDPLCGNGICGDFENPGNCPQDCGSSNETNNNEPLCGNGICGDFENPGNCPQDCK